MIKWGSVRAAVRSIHHSLGPKCNAAPPKEGLAKGGARNKVCGYQLHTHLQAMNEAEAAEAEGDLEMGDGVARIL